MDQKSVEAIVETSPAPRITQEHVDACIAEELYHVWPGTTLTTCVLVLRNGFTVSGEAACASPENFNAEVGGFYAKRDAMTKVWQLEAYLLRERLHGEGK